MIPRWPFLSGVITSRHCSITSYDCQESCDFNGHCLKVMTPDKKDNLEIIFGINRRIRRRKHPVWEPAADA